MNQVSPALQNTGVWSDIQSLSGLRREASQDSKAALPAVAKQFESLFMQMLIKSMRSASFGGGILDSPQSNQWRDMFDNQIALSLANDGKGMGIAAMLVRQLGGNKDTQGTSSSGDAAKTTAMPLTPALRNARTVNAIRAASGGSSAPADNQTDSPNFLERVAQIAGQAGHVALHAASDLAFSNPVDFVRTLAPYAKAAAEKLGVSTRAVLAQAALETGWGKHMPQQASGSSSHNLFGIKSGRDWQRDSVTATTQEYTQGTPASEDASFRSYATPLQSFADYVRLLSGNPRYAGALDQGDNVAAFGQALHRAGYATDPNYAAKLTTIANSDTMREALASLKDSPPSPTTEL
ncbi:MAG: flagellar assembly peptidoglycan hydrolase FlgJ [Rhodanobacteraceae bacterium]